MKAVIVKLQCRDMIVITMEVPQVLLIINTMSMENSSRSQNMRKDTQLLKRRLPWLEIQS